MQAIFLPQMGPMNRTMSAHLFDIPREAAEGDGVRLLPIQEDVPLDPSCVATRPEFSGKHSWISPTTAPRHTTWALAWAFRPARTSKRVVLPAPLEPINAVMGVGSSTLGRDF